MKVLFTANVPSPYRVDFFNELGKLCDLTVLFETQSAKSRNKSWIADQAKNFKIVYMKGFQMGEAEAICPEIIRYIEKFKNDMIIIGMYSTPTAMIAIEWMRLKKVPFYISSDGGVKKNEREIIRAIKKHFISSARGWLSTGNITTEYMKYYGADEQNIWVYPFSSVKECDIIPSVLSLSEKKLMRSELNMPEKRIVLSVGQFIYRKGYDVLCRAAANMPKDIGIYIVGGQVTEEYLALKKKLKLDHVHFVDFIQKKELARFYEAADIFVLPTREDIWGLVINEAMSYGLPVVTTDKCVAGLELVENEVNGRIVRSENAGELGEAILFTLDHPEMGEIALKTAQKYTIESMARSHIDFLKQRKDTIK